MGLLKKRPLQIISDIIGAALANIFGKTYETDSIILSNGIHEINVTTEGMAARVWVSFDEDDDDELTLPVCHGNIDKVGIMRTDCGFILFAEIHSTSRKIRWFSSTNARRDDMEYDKDE